MKVNQLLGGIILGLLIAGGVYYGVNKAKTSKADDKSKVELTDTVNDKKTDQAATSVKTVLGDAPILGKKDQAKIAIVEFSDYECPFCKHFVDQTFGQIEQTYINSGKAIFAWHDFPLDFHEPASSQDSTAARCVGKLGGDEQYFKMNKLIFANTGLNGQGMSQAKFSDLAVGLGLKKDDFEQCLASNDFKARIADDIALGEKAGVSGTPAFIIGKYNGGGQIEGEFISGAQPFAVFQQKIEALLSN